MQRFAHELKALKTDRYPRHVIFFDTETKVIKQGKDFQSQSLNLGWVLSVRYRPDRLKNTETWEYFEKPDQFWGFIDNQIPRRETVWLVAHNLPFDFTIVKGFSSLAIRGYKPSFAFWSGQTTIFKFAQNGRNLLFIDSLNLFKASIAELGERIGLPKMECNPLKDDRERVKTYCKRDVEILYRTFTNNIQYLKDNKFGSLGYSIASQSLITFRRRFYQGGIFLHDNEQAIKLERESYRGGRCEAFHIGEVPAKQIYCLDVNSMYPYVMKHFPYPKKLIHFQHKSRVRELLKIPPENLYIARVLVRVDKPIVGIKKDRLLFPVGEFPCVLTSNEIKRVMEYGKILDVKEVAIYEAGDIFSTFIDELYRLRIRFKESGDNFGSVQTKTILNSLYGKFGQRGERWEYRGESMVDDISIELIVDYDTGKRRFIRHYGGISEEKTGEMETINSFPAIASFVTSYARETLEDYIDCAGRDNVYYCDTDSLFVSEVGFKRLQSFIHDSDLGKLKLEKTGTKLIIRGAKDYTIDETIRLKGVSRHAVRINEDTFRQPQFPKMSGIIRDGMNGTITIKQITKSMKRTYFKGLVGKDGKVKPLGFGKGFELPFDEVVEG